MSENYKNIFEHIIKAIQTNNEDLLHEITFKFDNEFQPNHPLFNFWNKIKTQINFYMDKKISREQAIEQIQQIVKDIK